MLQSYLLTSILVKLHIKHKFLIATNPFFLQSLNSKQRQLRKSGNQLSEVDSNELQRISAEQAILQKHLESSRKQSRQHGMLIQVPTNNTKLATKFLF